MNLIYRLFFLLDGTILLSSASRILTISSIPIALSILVFGIFVVSSVNTVQSQPSLYPHESKPFNFTMGEWLKRYWSWTASIPVALHPKNDINGEHCGTNQTGPVWFLDAPIAPKVTKIFSCEIPEGKAIFVPLLVAECDSGDTQPPTDPEIKKCALEGNDGGNTIFSVDGKKLLMINKTSQSQKDYSLYRTTSDFFNIYWPQQNYYDVPSGTFRGIADGYFAIVQPLPLGNHKIDFHTSVYSGINPEDYNQDVDVTYNIKIVKSQNSTS